MVPFKPSIHRIYFIDKKVRENTYPTTVSLASDYEEAYGSSVDPRTIAADIAALKEKFHAPLRYDYQNRGYYYDDPYFQLPILQNDPDNPLPTMAEERHPRTAVIPEWQQLFIASLIDRVFPLQKGEKRYHPKVSVLLEIPEQWETEMGAVKKALLQALNDNTALNLRYMAGKKTVSLVFYPLHLICTLGFNLVFGMTWSGEKKKYRLLYVDRIKEATMRQETLIPPPYVYIQTTGNQDIEVVLARENSDIVLVFTIPPDNLETGLLPEYTLLVQTEIFA
jgi:predicted DNA-binding transcriptional regulator YafY